jgi:hypothetical protein
LGDNTQKEEQSRMKTEKVLMGINEKIQKNPLLKEVYGRKREDYSDLIEKYGGEKVLMAVELVESYRLLMEIKKAADGKTLVSDDL